MRLAKLTPSVQTLDLRAVKPAERQAWEQGREHRSSTKLGYNYKWQKAREQHLQKEPLCRACMAEGRLNDVDLHVDHIVPHRGDQSRFWSRDNWQTLCSSHHSEKTAKEDGGFNNPKR